MAQMHELNILKKEQKKKKYAWAEENELFIQCNVIPHSNIASYSDIILYNSLFGKD